MSATHDDLRDLADQIRTLRGTLLNSSGLVLAAGTGPNGLLAADERAPDRLLDACQAVLDAANALAHLRELLETLIAAERKSADILQFRRGPSDAVH